jgi:hypothetical protein
MLNGPFDFLFKSSKESARINPFSDYSVDIPEPFWNLIKVHFLETFSEGNTTQLQKAILVGLRNTIAREIETQLTNQQTPPQTTIPLDNGLSDLARE